MVISRITKVILKNCQKIGKMTHLTVKNGIFKKFQKYSILYGTRLTQPKYHSPRWKTVTCSLKQKIYLNQYLMPLKFNLNWEILPAQQVFPSALCFLCEFLLSLTWYEKRCSIMFKMFHTSTYLLENFSTMSDCIHFKKGKPNSL